MSIRVKVLGIVLGVILLLSLFVTLQMRSVMFDTLRTELAQQGTALIVHVADQTGELLDDQQVDSLRFYLLDRQIHYSSDTHNTRIAYLAVFDSDGKIIATTLPDDAIPSELQPANLDQPLSALHDHLSYLSIGDAAILDIATSIGDQGLVRLGLDEGRIGETVNIVTLQLLTITLIMIVIGLGAAIFLTWILTQPIMSLVAATQAVSQGDFTRRVPRWANDELGELATAFNTMTESLAQAEHERQEKEALRARYVSGVIVAQEDERKRIARELHDSTGQSLTSILVGLQNLKTSTSPEEIASRSDELRGVISRTIDEVRNLAWQLRPSALDDLGLLSALDHYISEFQTRYDIPVDFVANGLAQRLPREMETSIYRIIQEALTNIARHAQANYASVMIDKRQSTLRIVIEDDGIGFDPNRVQDRSLGLQGIRERAALFQGTITLESRPSQGTALFVTLPYDLPENLL
ncbi:MAG: sensor histidine kinase [Anaerolineae bacterium]|nr:sensor histidine kinase [Anaerolineae bacterium]